MEVKNNSFLNEIRYYEIFEKIQESVMVFDVKRDDNNKIVDLVFKYINPVTAHKLGISRKKITGVSFSKLYGLEVTAPYLDISNRIHGKEKCMRFEVYFAPLDEYFLVSTSFLDDSLYFTLNIDITKRKYRSYMEELVEKRTEELMELTKSLKNEIQERKKAEKELKKSKSYYKTIFENTGTATLIVEEDTTISLVNTECEKLSGYSKEEIEGKKSWKEFIWEDDIKRMDEYHNLRRIDPDLAPRNYESKFIDGYGNVKYVFMTVAMIPGTNKSLISLLDITDRKNAEEGLKESEEKFRELFNNADDMISLNMMKENGLPGRFIEVNEVGTERLGYSKDELLNMSPVDLVAPDKKIEMPKNATELWTKGRAKFEIVHVAKNGKRIPVEVNNHLFKLKGKTVALAISRDIGERKKTEEEMKKLINDLKRSNDELEQFAYVASHDLQEPLRTIASFTQLLERRYKGKFGKDADEFMDYIVDASFRMKDQIEGLLEFSRVATREKTFEQVNMNDILNYTMNNLKTLIEENNAKITYDPLPKLMGDADQLQRVFQNIISNAIKFKKEEESPKIHISVQRNEENNEYVFSIADNGIGIEKQYMERIFVIFKRLHTQDEYKGTGIGLSIVKRIIERHNGRIWVESDLGRGATFYFTLPLTKKVM
jgi:PAS domain S-box-containing protein